MTFTILSGLLISGTYLLIAIGFILMIRVADIVNMAYGAFVVVGMYFVYDLVGRGLPLVAAVTVAPLAGALFGWLLFAVVIGRSRRQGHRHQIVITALLLSLIEVALQLRYGGDPLLVKIRRQAVTILGASFQRERVIAAVVGIVVSLLIAVALRRSVYGKLVEASSAYEDSARSLGVPVERVYGAVFVLGSALAFLAGGLMVGYTPLHPYLSVEILIVAILIALVGRLSIPGAALAALGYGLGYSFLVRVTSNPGLSNVIVLAALLGTIVAAGLAASLTRSVRRV